MTDTKKIQAAIRETLQRNLEILIGESAGRMDAQDDDGQIRSMQAVTTRDVRAMLDACAVNLAIMFEEWRRE